MSASCFAGEPKGIPTITDGDTLKILNEKIRLDGIDAPESGQRCLDKNGAQYQCGTLATVFLENIINQNLEISSYLENGYINLISINKNLESYDGIYVKLINFKSKTPFEKKDLQCNRLNEIININKTVFKEYEYSKLNNQIKSNLKSINDYILFNDNDEYNYIVLCDLTYNEDLLKNINFNKNVNSLVNKIQNKFLIKYKNEYKFIKIK